jgi:hypothetical protein
MLVYNVMGAELNQLLVSGISALCVKILTTALFVKSNLNTNTLF